MDYFETRYTQEGYYRIAGVDEAGRGPLAGPVVAAAIILPPEGVGEPLFDSKKLSAKKRERLYEVLCSKALAIGIGIVSSEEIDSLNILQATLKAMTQAVEHLSIPPDLLLIDGPHGLPLSIPQKAIPKGDQLSNSIAAASIVAKVTRDRLMLQFHQKYPQYNFARHKGYGTLEHRRAIERFGICDIHRKTFRGVKEFFDR
jgi:ribonuclease HII